LEAPKAFVKPNEFIPERWSSQPELILDKNAWFPFVIGRYGCIGKQLALNEMRTVMAKLVLEFNITFAKGEDGHRLLEESHDIFTFTCSELDLVFTARE
jgi:cytochrome P450 family 628